MISAVEMIDFLPSDALFVPALRTFLHFSHEDSSFSCKKKKTFIDPTALNLVSEPGVKHFS